MWGFRVENSVERAGWRYGRVRAASDSQPPRGDRLQDGVVRGPRADAAVSATLALSAWRLALAALRVGLVLVGIGAATDALFLALDRAPGLVVGEGVAMAAAAFAACRLIAPAGRILRARGRMLLRAGLFAVWGAADDRVWSDYGEVAIALVALAASVSPPLVVVGCIAVASVGFGVGLSSVGHLVHWVLLGGGVGLLANQVVGLCLTGGVMLIAISALRSTLCGAAASLALARTAARR
jgi:hypothetical protein